MLFPIAIGMKLSAMSKISHTLKKQSVSTPYPNLYNLSYGYYPEFNERQIEQSKKIDYMRHKAGRPKSEVEHTQDNVLVNYWSLVKG